MDFENLVRLIVKEEMNKCLLDFLPRIKDQNQTSREERGILYTAEEATQYINMSISWLAIGRMEGRKIYDVELLNV